MMFFYLVIITSCYILVIGAKKQAFMRVSVVYGIVVYYPDPAYGIVVYYPDPAMVS